MLRWAMPGIGAVGLDLAVGARGRSAGPWLTVAIDAWFVVFGLMLSMTVAAEQIAVSGQFDPGPDVITHLNRLESWLDPMVQRPVAAAFLIAGTIGIVASAKARSAPR
jgi:hypothetical protein